jgi:hypothetical protein
MTTLPVMSIARAKTMLDAGTALYNTGGAANIYIRTGAQPATTLTADSGTLLSTLPMTNPAFGAATSATANGLATATAAAITSDTNAAATGTAGHFRIKNGAATVVSQGNVGTSGADLNLNTTTINAGDTVAITSLKETLPCGDGVS